MAKLDINEIALEAHVSSLHVMQVLYSKTQTLDADEVTRILHIIRRQGLEDQFYALTNRSNRIGIFATGEFGMDFAGHVTQAISEVANQAGYAIEYNFRKKPHPLQPDDFLDLIGNKGVIVVASAETQLVVETCKLHNCPYVLVETGYRDGSSAGVEIVTNNQQAIESSMRHLIDLGHRHFAYVAGEFTNQSMRERLESYRSLLQTAGLPDVPDRIIETDWTEAAAFEHSQRLFTEPDPPTALLCGNDIIAFGVIRAAQSHQLTVGAQVSVIGFDDIEMASEVTPALTTLRQPMRQMGEEAFAQLQRLMEGQPPTQTLIQFPAELVVRGSTGPAPH